MLTTANTFIQSFRFEMTNSNIAFADDLCLHIMNKTLIIVGIFL